MRSSRNTSPVLGALQQQQPQQQQATPTTPSAYEFSDFVSASPEAAAAAAGSHGSSSPSGMTCAASAAAAGLQPIAVPPSSVSPPPAAFVVGITPVVPEDGPSDLVYRVQQRTQRAGSDGIAASYARTLANIPEIHRASSESRTDHSPTRSSSDQSVGLTPAVHTDSEQRIGSFTPAAHIAPARAALAAYPSASPSPGALSDVSETPIMVPSPPPERPPHATVTVPPLHSTPMMSLSSGASTPAASVASNNRHVDIPLHYSSQYSPSAASRRLSGSAGGLAPASAEKRHRSRSASPSIQDPSTSSSSSAASAISLVASPNITAAAAQRGFLSNLFGWGGSSPATGAPGGRSGASVSVPGTPVNEATSLHHQQFPHTTTNAGGITKSSSSQSFAHVSAHAPLSLTASPSLGSLMAETSSAHSAASFSSSASSSASAAHRVSLQPVGGGMHPLLVRPILPLTVTQHAQLLSYSVRLKSALAGHEKKIAALQAMKRKFQRTRNEETSIWNKFAISSLVSIAASLYHTHLLHCSARLQMEFGYTTELSAHLNQVQLVLDGKLALKTLLDELDQLQDRHDRLEEEQILALQRSSTASASGSSSTYASAAASGGNDLGPSGWTKEVAEKMKQLAQTRVQRERRRSSAGNAAGLVAAGAGAAAAANATPASLKDHFLTSSEIDVMFLPKDHALLVEQVGSLGETLKKLEATYAAMQKKALSQSDSKQTRTFRLHTILVKHGLESPARDRGVDGEFFCLRMDSEILTAQTNFNTLILDQRTEEGKSIAKWLDAMQSAHAESIVDATSGGSAFRPVSSVVLPHVSPVSILSFLSQLQGEIAKRYDFAQMEREREKEVGRRMPLDDNGEDSEQYPEPSPWTLSDCLSLYLARMLYPKLGVLLSSLRSEQEVDLDQWFHKKLAWIRELTRAQIGLNPMFLPPGCVLHEGHRSRATAAQAQMMKGDLSAKNNAASAPEDDVDFPDDDDDDQDGEHSETDDDHPHAHSHQADGHLASTQQPYTSAMSILHRLNIACETQAPIDMLFLLIRTIREVTKTANGFLEMHREKERAAYLASGGTLPPPPGVKLGPAHAESLHADNMFPLVLYMVIHSQLTSPHYVFGTLTRFLSADLRHFGTSGYALAMIESAVSHVCDMTKQQVQQNNGQVRLTSPKLPSRSSQLEGTPPLAAMSRGAFGLPVQSTCSTVLPPPPASAVAASPAGSPTSIGLPAVPVSSSSSSPHQLSGAPALQHQSSGGSPPALPSSSPN